MPGAGDLGELVDAIFKFSGGHPEAVSLAADLIDTAVDTGAIIDALEDYTFVERCPDDGGPAAWRFHEFIRQERDARLAVTDPDRYEELHSWSNAPGITRRSR